MTFSILPYLIVVAMAATAIVLFEGIGVMASHAPDRDETENMMMWWRVGLQGLTIALLALYAFLH